MLQFLGHVEKLLNGIENLQHATEEDKLMMATRPIVGSLNLEPLQKEQDDFWKALTSNLLAPDAPMHQKVHHWFVFINDCHSPISFFQDYEQRLEEKTRRLKKFNGPSLLDHKHPLDCPHSDLGKSH